MPNEKLGMEPDTPFPLMHVDTTWKIREMTGLRDRKAKELGFELIVYTNQEGVKQNINPFATARLTPIS